jgi:hypothetical protein
LSRLRARSNTFARAMTTRAPSKSNAAESTSVFLPPKMSRQTPTAAAAGRWSVHMGTGRR